MSLSLNGKPTAQTVLNTVREISPFHNKLYSLNDDISSARLFADVFKDSARYNVTAREWYVYDGIRWKEDKEGMHTEEYAKLLARALLIYSADIGDRNYTDYVSRLQDRKKRTLMITDSRDFNFVEASDFDSDPYLFNCQNCVLNLKTFEHIEHSADLLLSKVSNVVFDDKASSPDFEKFIREIMRNDEDKIKYLQKIFGYALTGENTQEEAYLIYGATTRNGKSTMLDTFEYLFGDYALNCQPETLAIKDRNSRGASGDIARLDGVRFLHCGEPPKRMRFDVALLKSLLGRDQITARRLYESEFQFIPCFKLFINTNFLPIVSDDSLFSSDRLKVITFDRHFDPEEQDIHLKRRLKSQQNISGIFNWILEGLLIYQEEGESLDPPKAVVDATADYRSKSDKYGLFLTDCLIECPGENVSAKSVYEVFCIWCRENGFGTESKSNFLDELRSKGILSDRGTVDGVSQHNVIKNYQIDKSFGTDNPFINS